ncbi:glycosyltransferase family 1 protein [Bernardetia sp. ABR2-2B]|uniref:glycosyltransferase family 4 protein n=1 Tax=Bernardetia sp. ABR2-2B TaxID=3127472 RepID=UPI0030D4C953
MKVVYLHRKPRQFGNFSIESYFEDIRSYLPSISNKVEPIVYQSPFFSDGILPRIKNILDAKKQTQQLKSDINHITGDVHFLTMGLNPKKTILTIHDCAFLEQNVDSIKGKLKRKFLKIFWLDIPVKQARFITAVSEATKNEIIKHTNCNPNKIIVIPTTISPKFIEAAQDYTPKKFNSEKPVILQLGAAFNKNLERLFESLGGINCKLHIIAPLSEHHFDLLRKFNIDYKHEDKVSFEELILTYKNCDLVSFVSTIEGFGMPIIEAQTLSKPIITSNISSMPWVAGNAAHLVNPYSVKEIKEGILKIINEEDYRNNLIEKGKENIKRFNSKTVTRQYVELYDRIMKNGD